MPLQLPTTLKLPVMPNALWHLSSQHSTIRPARLTEEGLHVRSLYSLVSTGTERLVARGEVPASLHELMAVPGMEGQFSFPVKYGYSLVGRVEAPGHPMDGRLVHCLHPHQEACRLQEEALYPLPETVPPLRATLASNLETAVNAVWDSKVSVGDRVLVLGFGMIGGLLSRVLSMMPAISLLIAEPSTARRSAALQMGFDACRPEEVQGAFDHVFHTSGSGAGLQLAIEQAGMEGTITELSWYGTREATVRLGGHFHYRRQQIISSQVSHLPAHRRPRWDYRRRKDAVFRLLETAAFDQHIQKVLPFADAPGFFDHLRAGAVDEIGTALQYT